MATVKKKRKRKTGLNVKAKKKRAAARAVVKKGSGKIKVNKRDLNLFEPRYLKEFIEEPLQILPDVAKEVDIKVNVKGGGFMSQAAATRSAIAKSLVLYSKDAKAKQAMLAYDRLLLVDDVRRVESKKPLGTKARKKKQKSKR
jgi:small subunit ribosomal protein S9